MNAMMPPTALLATPLPADAGAVRSRSTVACIVALIAIVFIAHGQDLRHAFVDWDDPIMLGSNPLLNPPTSESLKAFWLHGVDGLYTPFAYTVWAGIAAVTARGRPLSAWPFHLLNVSLHVFATIAVFFFIWRFLRVTTGRLAPAWPALAGAALFAVHPLQVEPVAWVAGMNNLLAGGLSIGCAGFYLKSLDPMETRRLRAYAMAAVFLLLALLAKPTAIATPIVLVVIDRAITGGAWRCTLLRSLPMVAVAIPFVLIGRAVQPAANVAAIPVISRLIVAGDALGFYVSKVAVPASLAMDYGRTPQRVLDAGGSIGNWFGLAVIVIGFAIAVRRWSPAAMAIGVFVAALSPVLGLVPFSYQLYSTTADRYAYVAMLGPAMLLAAALARWPGRAVHVASVAGLSAMAAIAVYQSTFWTSSVTLGTHAVAVNPDSLAAHGMLGHAYAVQGKFAAAEAEDREALRVSPDDADANFNLGCLLMQRSPGEALTSFAAAAAAGFADPTLYRNSGIAWLNLNQPARAMACFDQARRDGLVDDAVLQHAFAVAQQRLAQRRADQ